MKSRAIAFRSWLRSVVREWRAQIQECRPGAEGPLHRFHAPCQIDVIWTYHKLHRLDYRICVVSHFSDLPDLDIQIWGPYLPYDLPAELEKFLGLPKWQRDVPIGDVTLGILVIRAAGN